MLNSSSDKKLLRIVTAGVFTALVSVVTMLAIPLPGGHGYVNLGDALIHIVVFAFGDIYAVAIAALGSAIADLILGYTVYAPCTLIVKGLMALMGILLITRFKHKPIAFFISGLIVPFGYFIFELLLYSADVAALNLIWNMLQYAVSAIVTSVVLKLLEKPIGRFRSR